MTTHYIKIQGTSKKTGVPYRIVQSEDGLLHARLIKFNENHDDKGRFAASDSSGGGGDTTNLNQEVTSVGGDSWNQETAVRLEKEYVAAKPSLEAIEKSISDKTTVEGGPDAEDAYVGPPEEWSMVGDQLAADIETYYKEHELQNVLDSEIENWSSEHAPQEAKSMVANQFENKSDQEWAKDAIKEWRAQREEAGLPRVPYTDQQLLDAVNLNYDPDKWISGQGMGQLSIEFADDKLANPDTRDDNQGTLPGVSPPEWDKSFTKEMRNSLEGDLTTAFDKASTEALDKLEPPDYLKDSAQEYLDEAWSSMEDEQKFNYAKNNTSYIDDIVDNSLTETRPVTVPNKFDPLNETTGVDYKSTQDFARYVSLERATQVIENRGLTKGDHETTLDYVKRMEAALWQGWKGSSTSSSGLLMQAATADELGGRLNLDRIKGATDLESIIKQADDNYRQIGGYAGVKAYIRGKWETTQYLLDKSGNNTLELYRAVGMHPGNLGAVLDGSTEGRSDYYSRLPDMKTVRNGAASTTTNKEIANGWGSNSAQSVRVVLRSKVPRTAALSIPAYGQNVFGEKEVVIAGTAWHGWDAWKGKAPDFHDVPMKSGGIAKAMGKDILIDLFAMTAGEPNWLSGEGKALQKLPAIRAKHRMLHQVRNMGKFNPDHDERGRFASGGSLGTGNTTIFQNIDDALLWANTAPISEVIKSVVKSQPFRDAVVLAVAGLVTYAASDPAIMQHVQSMASDMGITIGQSADTLRSVFTGLRSLLMKAKDDPKIAVYDRIIAALKKIEDDQVGKFNENHDERGRFSSNDSRGDAATGTGITREAAQDSARQVCKDLSFDVNRVDISSESKTFMLNGVSLFYAGSAEINKGQDGRITLYTPHLSLESVDGVVAHEIEHEKFQAVMDAKQEEQKAVMTDPGPAPDPNGRYYWQKQGGAAAVMTPDGSLREPYDKKYPIYQKMWEVLEQHSYQKFADSDGVSNYSAEYWKAWREGGSPLGGSPVDTKLAFHETLAEMARIKYTTGKFPDHLGSVAGGNWKPSSAARAKMGDPQGHKIWRDLFRAVTDLYPKVRK